MTKVCALPMQAAEKLCLKYQLLKVADTIFLSLQQMNC